MLDCLAFRLLFQVVDLGLKNSVWRIGSNSALNICATLGLSIEIVLCLTQSFLQVSSDRLTFSEVATDDCFMLFS